MPPVGHVTAALAKVAAVASIAYDMLLESSMPTMLQYGSVDQAVGEWLVMSHGVYMGAKDRICIMAVKAVT